LRYWWRKNPQVQQAASRLITLKVRIMEKNKGEEYKPPRRTKEHKVPDFLVLSLFRVPSAPLWLIFFLVV
jgi:hypothetical protein